MNASLQRRLQQIIPKITQAKFLDRQGTGNDIACHIFDYPAESELQVREYIAALCNELTVSHTELEWRHINLLDVMTGYLENRKLLDRAVKMQKTKGDEAVIRALAGPLAAEKISNYIHEVHQPEKFQLIIMSGVGSVWPVIRLHSLLNCMHKTLDGTPMVIFYPGKFDKTTLHLFNRQDTGEEESTNVGSQRYYRAFTLIPEEV